MGSLLMASGDPSRTTCRIFATVKYQGLTAKGRVHNLSRTGIMLDLYEPLSVPVGSKVELQSEELGYLYGKLRSVNGSFIDLSLELSSNSLAQVSSYFRHFHEDLKPVLRS